MQAESPPDRHSYLVHGTGSVQDVHWLERGLPLLTGQP